MDPRDHGVLLKVIRSKPQWALRFGTGFSLQVNGNVPDKFVMAR